MNILRAAVAVVTTLVAVNAAAADAAAGKTAYAVCAACHGANGEGNQALGAPQIAGLGAWYLARQIGNFRAGVRGAAEGDTFGAQMRPMAMALADDAAVANVAAYVASLEPKKQAATVDGDAAAGKGAYAPCAACHGQNGEGNKAVNAPRLTTLPDWYIVRQIEAFKAGRRGTHADDQHGQQMRTMALILGTEQAVKDVAAYIATLD